MFTKIEAKNYRCLKEVSQTLNPFEILVGPNGSGKSTFLDVVGFLSDLASDGLEAAVERRTENFQDLVYGRRGSTFGLRVDAAGPTAFLPPEQNSVHYEVLIHTDAASGQFFVGPHDAYISPQAGNRYNGSLASWGEGTTQRRPFDPVLFPPGNLPFLTAPWLARFLRDGIRTVALEGRHLADPSPAGSAGEKRITGMGLARLVGNLKSQHPDNFRDWLSHVQTALPEIRDIESVPLGNTRYLAVRYGDVDVPSWMLSEGTLRLLQLTILAYLPVFDGVYLIEEPENGVHPSALEAIYQSLSSIYGAQVLVSSHSPILLNMAKPEQLLCFSKSPDGVKIVRGSDHPALKDWQNEVSLGTLAASGILG